MHQSSFGTLPTMENHKCETSRAADWVIHECPICDYQLWKNLLTGEIKVLNAKVDISHFGFYVPEDHCKESDPKGVSFDINPLDIVPDNKIPN